MYESIDPKGLILILLIISFTLTGCTEGEVKDITGNVISKSKEAVEYVDRFTSNETVRHEAKVDSATMIATMVKNSNLKEIDLKNIQSYDNYKEMIDNLNLMVKIINEKGGTGIKYFSKEIGAYDKFLLEVNRYTPLINNYNDLIYYSKNLDPTNEESVNMLITKSVGFTVEAILIFGGVFYKFAYLAVGNFASALGLTKFASVCGPCVSAVMSSGHWIIRNGMIEKTSGLSEAGADLLLK